LVGSISNDEKKTTGKPVPSAVPASAILVDWTLLEWVLFLFLLLFSALEFTFPFLTFDWLHYSQQQQGMLLGVIGMTSALLQGGWVRRVLRHDHHSSSNAPSIGEKERWLLLWGLVAGSMYALSCGVLALLPRPVSDEPQSIQLARLVPMAVVVASMSFASATVVNCLNGLISMSRSTSQEIHETSQPSPDENQGEVMGRSRSVGQLGRALGPFMGCVIYWGCGAWIWYGVAAVAMAIPFSLIRFGYRVKSKRA
jgi:hypothetical protein